ncbi:MAG TPA: MFS transporter [Candidatus Humimicrobiaceae bacterium]
MQTKIKKTGSDKLQIGLAASSHFLIDIYQSFYVGLIPLLTLKFGLSLFKVSLLGATSMIANSLFAPLFGYLADRYGLKYFVIAGPIITSVFLSFVGVLPNYWIIILFIFLGNLGIASYHPASAAMAAYYGGNKKGFYSSIISFGGNFGAAFGSLLIILILKKIGINFTPLAMIPGIVIAIVLLKFVPSKQNNALASKNLKIFSKIKRMDRRKLFLIFTLIFSVYSLYILWITLVNFMPLYFTGLNVSLINIGIILLLFGTLGGSGGILTGYLYDRFKNGYILIQIALIVAIPLLYFIFQTNGITSIALFILSGVFLVSLQPVCIRIVQDMLPGNVSLASSLILGLSSGLAGVTMIFLGKAADIIGIEKLVRYELLFLFAAFLILFSYPFIGKKLVKS